MELSCALLTDFVPVLSKALHIAGTDVRSWRSFDLKFPKIFEPADPRA
jgi:hypothetical protein